MKKWLQLVMGLSLILCFVIAATLPASAGITLDIQGQVGYTGYHIFYDANGGEGGYTGRSVSPGGVDRVLSLEETGISRKGYAFTGWNTRADGQGSHYTARDQIIFGEEHIILYAQWRKIIPTGGGASGNEVKNQTGLGRTSSNVRTGDKGVMSLWYCLFSAAFTVLVILIKEERRKKEQKTAT